MGTMLVLAHRGGSGPWPENSLEAFAGAARAGADGVELDVRRTADGALAVAHDPTLAGVGALAGLRRDELPPGVPVLEAALAACAGLVVRIEVKNDPAQPGADEPAAAAVVEVLARTPPAPAGPERVVVSSFWPGTLEAVARHARRAQVGLGTALLVHPALDAGSSLAQAVELGCCAVDVPHPQVTGELVAAARARGLAVVAWTVDDPDDLRRVAAAGADGVITDDVRSALEVLGALGARPAGAGPAPRPADWSPTPWFGKNRAP